MTFFTPRSTQLQLLAIREKAEMDVQLVVVSMAFRGSMCSKVDAAGQMTRRLKTSKPTVGPVLATATKSLHCKILEPAKVSSRTKDCRIGRVDFIFCSCQALSFL